MRRYPSSIVGLPYPNNVGLECHRAVVEAGLAANDTVELLHGSVVPDGPVGVSVWASGYHLGWIPARHGFVAEQLDSGREIVATVTKIERDVSKRVTAVFLAIDLPSSTRAAADFSRR